MPNPVARVRQRISTAGSDWAHVKSAAAGTGFTLIELLLVLVLLGLTASVALVSVDGLTSRWRERSVANEVQSALKMARLWSVAGRTSVRVEVRDGPEALSVYQGATLKKIVRVPKPMQLTASADLKSSPKESFDMTFVFWPDGTLDGGLLQLTSGDRVIRQYVLDPTIGRVRASP